MSGRPAIGLDVGGSSLKAGLVTPDGEIVFRRSVPTRPARGAPEIEEDLIALHAECAGHFRETVGSKGAPLPLPSVGLSLPGVLSEDGGSIVRADNLPSLNGHPLIRNLRMRLGDSLVVGADCRLAAIAERELGAARGVARVMVTVIGTGVGATLLIDGEPTNATQFGQIAIPSVPGDSDDRTATLESLASGWALDSAVRGAIGQRLEHGQIRSLLETASPEVTRVVTAWARALVRGFSAWMREDPVEKIIMAGGITRYGPSLVDTVRGAWRDTHPHSSLSIEFSLLGGDGPLLGAALAAMRAAPSVLCRNA